MMFNADENAKAVARANRKRANRRRAAYENVFSTAEGRAFIVELMAMGNLYDSADDDFAEGRRRLAVVIRRAAIEYGLFDKWQLAEKEEAQFQQELKIMIEQTEAKEEDSNGF